MTCGSQGVYYFYFKLLLKNKGEIKSLENLGAFATVGWQSSSVRRLGERGGPCLSAPSEERQLSGFFMTACLILFALRGFTDSVFFFFFVNWRFVAALCGTGQWAPFFQHHLLSLCPCVSFWWFMRYFMLFRYYYICYVIYDQGSLTLMLQRLWLAGRSGDSISNRVFLRWLFLSARVAAAGGLSPVAWSGGAAWLWCAGAVLRSQAPEPGLRELCPRA